MVWDNIHLVIILHHYQQKKKPKWTANLSQQPVLNSLTMKIGDKKHWKPCQAALILTTKSFIDIFKDLKENHNCEYILGGID